ncbi:hypothetical protein [Piscirickettsia litoralis]|uniref:Uncharacterized protein n=1 Tax=Piscirickettsia litoralis TaxID=1891921 RepID=A0ABX2ZWS9_9GAMM|nr:hypothetical protein [Piscirickettsia litoralis]ODN41012.1 hypothetical protein BGC07_18445 [Piscirickettsia litoralis]
MEKLKQNSIIAVYNKLVDVYLNNKLFIFNDERQVLTAYFEAAKYLQERSRAKVIKKLGGVADVMLNTSRGEIDLLVNDYLEGQRLASRKTRLTA